MRHFIICPTTSNYQGSPQCSVDYWCAQRINMAHFLEIIDREIPVLTVQYSCLRLQSNPQPNIKSTPFKIPCFQTKAPPFSLPASLPAMPKRKGIAVGECRYRCIPYSVGNAGNGFGRENRCAIQKLERCMRDAKPAGLLLLACPIVIIIHACQSVRPRCHRRQIHENKARAWSGLDESDRCHIVLDWQIISGFLSIASTGHSSRSTYASRCFHE